MQTPLQGSLLKNCLLLHCTKNEVFKENQKDLSSSTTSKHPQLLGRSIKNRHDLAHSATKNKHN